MSFDSLAIARDFSRAADSYDAHTPMQHAILHDALTLFRGHMENGVRVLDAGCGTGRLVEAVHSAGLHWNLLALDIAEGMCRKARQHTAPAVCADMTTLPLCNATFDGVFSSLALQWADDPRTVFAEFYRVLRPGGLTMVTTLCPGSLSYLHAALPEIYLSSLPPAAAIEDACRDAGFTLLHSELREYHQFFATLQNALRHQKTIGATNKRHDRPRGLHGRNLLHHLHASPGSSPICMNYRTLLLLARKS